MGEMGIGCGRVWGCCTLPEEGGEEYAEVQSRGAETTLLKINHYTTSSSTYQIGQRNYIGW